MVTSPPDWQRLERADGVALLGPLAEGGAHYALPDSLEIARDGDRRPELRLELVRGVSPDLPPAPYGVLELSLALGYPLARALELVRGADLEATVTRAPVLDAWLTLRVLGDIDHPDDLMTPAPVRWDGLERAAWVLRLSSGSAALVRDCLEGGAVVLEASAQLEVEGIAPRLPLRARAVPAILAERLRALADAEGRVARAALVEYFSGTSTELPFEFQGPLPDVPRAALGERLADLVRTHLASFSPALDEPEGLLALNPPEALERDQFEWDLSRPERTARALTLTFNPLAAARAWAAEHGGGGFVATTEVPSLSTGVVSIAIDASLPALRRGVLETGVTVSVPAKPPHRVQSLVKTVTLAPPGDSAEIQLRLAPGEPLEFGYTSYAVVTDAGGIERLTAQQRPGGGERLALSAADFPVRFIAVAASQALLRIADVEATIARIRAGTEITESYALTAEVPALAIAVPRDEPDPALAIEASERGSGRLVRIEGASEALVDLHSFPGYGPHRVEVECSFEADEEVYAIELAPEGRTEDPNAIGVVHLTPAAPRKSWSWFSASPFAGGFHYRPYAGPGRAAAGWSEVRAGDEPLLVRTGAMV